MDKVRLLLGTRITGTIIEWTIVVWSNLTATLLIAFTSIGEFVRNMDIGGFLLLYLSVLFVWTLSHAHIRSTSSETNFQSCHKSEYFPLCNSLWGLRTFNIIFEVVHLGVFLAFLSAHTHVVSVIACFLRPILLIVFLIGSGLWVTLRQCKSKVAKEYRTLSQMEI